MLGLGWNGVAPFNEEVFDIMFDGQTASAVGVVPCEVHADELGARPVLGEFIVLKEDVTKVVGMAFTNIFDAKVVDV